MKCIEVLHCIIGQKTRFIVHISHLLNLCADKRDYSLFVTSKLYAGGIINISNLYANSMGVELFIIHYSKLHANSMWVELFIIHY